MSAEGNLHHPLCIHLRDPNIGCHFRLTQEGVPMVLPFLRRRRIPVTEDDIGLLLTRDEDSLMHENFSKIARTAIEVRLCIRHLSVVICPAFPVGQVLTEFHFLPLFPNPHLLFSGGV